MAISKKKNQLGQSFQEFLRTYVPPEPVPVENPIVEETICPLCLERFESGSISHYYPFCSDCSSEGLSFEVKSFAVFMAEKTIEEFDDMLSRWELVEGLRPEYKALKSERIMALREIKRAEC
ncbi:hypothetical protein [Bowmanella sp. JS7-9]|uniref:Restriction alleviation protein, Lar family n=1 Tax=Pseudobowmanella zhangzhouensis TaxID=1537679 RepID=A0ABW1XM95_9ALTE|nr:hypothetical protein [Bowmanella sp. JS7-9]TBX27271.1 hypothetical protein TK45_00515 [Bowmanella sp. JS7-9]